MIERRLSRSKAEIAKWREYDYVIVNDDFDRAYAELFHIYHAEAPQAVAEPGAGAAGWRSFWWRRSRGPAGWPERPTYRGETPQSGAVARGSGDDRKLTVACSPAGRKMISAEPPRSRARWWIRREPCPGERAPATKPAWFHAR